MKGVGDTLLYWTTAVRMMSMYLYDHNVLTVAPHTLINHGHAAAMQSSSIHSWATGTRHRSYFMALSPPAATLKASTKTASLPVWVAAVLPVAHQELKAILIVLLGFSKIRTSTNSGCNPADEALPGCHQQQLPPG